MMIIYICLWYIIIIAYKVICKVKIYSNNIMLGRLRTPVNIDDFQNAIHIIKYVMGYLSQENTKTIYKPTPEMRTKAQQTIMRNIKKRLWHIKLNIPKKERN